MATETQRAAKPEAANTAEHSKTSTVLHTAEKDIKPLQTFFTKFNNDWSMNFAGMLAYNLLVALLPILIAIIAVLGFVLSGNAGLKHDVITQITAQIQGVLGGTSTTKGANVTSLANSQIGKFSNEAGYLAIVAVILSIFGGSRLFIVIEGCLDIIYRVRPRTAVRQNLVAIGMLLLFIILVPVMVFTPIGLSFVFSFLQNSPLKNIPGFGLLLSAGSILGGLLAAFLLFEAIYFIVPNQRISWRNSWRGALVSAIAMELFLAVIFPFYTTHFLGSYTGQIGFAVILLVFLYYFAVILMLGAEINAFFFEGVRPIPNDLATFVSTMAGKLNKDTPNVESEAHINPKPTEHADREHIAEARQQEEHTRDKNLQKQQQIASKAVTQEKIKTKEKKPVQRPSKLMATLEVVIGSGLAFVVTLLRLRRKGK